uniref:Uncharacterized protein n=1 Tax=Timema tahoe TaxID=61484 RepID=A0A7R9NWG1_9NEOP|nr:unnamed protein product [Timema tahoe]
MEEWSWSHRDLLHTGFGCGPVSLYTPNKGTARRFGSRSQQEEGVASYSLNHGSYWLSGIVLVVQTFDEEQVVAITEASAAIYCSSVSADLAYVESHFGNLPGEIIALEVRDLPLVKAVKIMRGIEENLNEASGSVGTAIVDKFNRVLQRNPGWKVMESNVDILEGQTTLHPEFRFVTVVSRPPADHGGSLADKLVALVALWRQTQRYDEPGTAARPV